MAISPELSAAIEQVEQVLPLAPAPEGKTDLRWQAILAVASFIPAEAEAVWTATVRWSETDDKDLQLAVGTCLIEELLAAHFATFFGRVRENVCTDRRFANAFWSAWPTGQAAEGSNLRSFRALQRQANRLLGKSGFAKVVASRRKSDITPLPPTWEKPV